MCTGATVTEGWPQLRDPNPNAMPPSPDSDITSPMQAAKHLALAWQTGSMQQMIDPQSHGATDTAGTGTTCCLPLTYCTVDTVVQLIYGT